MAERVGLTVDGRSIAAEAADTVAAALWNAGVLRLRRSVSGEPRGVLCAMGICYECRVAIDGVPHRRACMELVRDGMVVETDFAAPIPHPAARIPDPESLSADVAVIGAGPAGVAAACRAAESGAKTLLLDDAAATGGQIHRRRPWSPAPPAARAWLRRLERSGAQHVAGATIAEASGEEEAFRLLGDRLGAPLAVSARRLVLATGARELFLPFPGWTLPGVMGAGGAQALAKCGASLAGRVAVVAGSGPLLLAVAAHLAKAGAEVALVAEQASLGALAGFGAALLRAPDKLLEAARYRAALTDTPYRTGAWIAEARGRERLEGVVVADRGGRDEIACDLAAVAHGLVPNTELARLLACGIESGAVCVDARQQTTVPGVFAAGETCGVAGLDVAVAEGEIAGLAVAGSSAAAPEVARARARGRALARRMARAFRPRPELRALARPDTIVCRCEDARLSSIAACGVSREAKLAARSGMGPCQGRVCGPALEFLFGWDSDTVRPPARPVPLGHLAR
jgi:NADPH-dependent 2,4-dienoyl-CoA reductase/sulfur reductase-like enzyme